MNGYGLVCNEIGFAFPPLSLPGASMLPPHVFHRRYSVSRAGCRLWQGYGSLAGCHLGRRGASVVPSAEGRAHNRSAAGARDGSHSRSGEHTR